MTEAVIGVLPELVRNQIAAGEVVERPASVVKELVENALDAGAKHIQVELEEGGTALIRITDDGCGMVAEDLELAFEAHATSKLREVSDLDHIASLGFRGEALASIASVSRCRLVSRPPDRDTGFSREVDGGQLGPIVECGAPVGTTIEVRDLFYNTPARRRFLKRASTELARCTDVVQRAALANLGVGFTALHGGRRVVDVEPRMDLRERLRRIFGAELADALVPVHGLDGSTELTGLIAPPRFARRDTSRQMWFLNGRSLRDKVLIRAMKEGYRGFLDDHRQPVAFLNLSLDPGAVDVNVHPTKSEVRFREERRLFGFIVRTLREGVATMDVATPGESLLRTAERRGGWEPSTLPDPGVLIPRSSETPPPPGFSTPVVREVPGRDEAEVPTEASGAPADAWAARDELRGPYVQVDRTYILRGLPDGFEIIDQHALHERITFEGLKADLARGAVEVQGMLVPELVELSRSEVQLLAGHLETIAKLGLELSVFGETTIAIQAAPVRWKGSPETLVRSVLAALQERGEVGELVEFLEDVLHSAACRGSVMAGDPLTEGEIQALLESGRRIPSDQTCPHGRPTRVRFTLADLEKAFHRR